MSQFDPDTEPMAHQLQCEINEYLKLQPIKGVSKILLSGDAEVTDLTSMAEVVVHYVDHQKSREFLIATVRWIRAAAEFDYSRIGSSAPQGIYAPGVPLIAVTSISGDIVVSAVRRYLTLEAV